MELQRDGGVQRQGEIEGATEEDAKGQRRSDKHTWAGSFNHFP